MFSIINRLSKLGSALDATKKSMDEETAPGSEEEAPPGLFAQVVYHIVLSATLSETDAEEIAARLKGNGAEEFSPPSRDGKVPLKEVSHIISSTVDFEGYEAAETALVNVVKPDWVDISLRKTKLAQPKAHSPDPRFFFSGLVVCVVDLPEGDKDAIIGGVLAMGGLYSGAVSRIVTHIVTLTMETEACEIAAMKAPQCKIVLPHWFDDCLRLGRRIDETPYILPSPELMDGRHNDSISGTARPDLQSSMSLQTGSLPSLGVSASQRENFSIFEGKSIKLAEDLGIQKHLRMAIEELITAGGGKITSELSEADTLVCQFREGAEYRRAATEGKVVGNLPWLYHIIAHNAWTSPVRRLLHYPVVNGGLPGFGQFRLALSNYSGEARIYLENLAKAAGCEFTKTMKMDNTHLITAHKKSEKCDAAKEWNINIVNHLWLEESYAKWQIQTLSNPRYTHFPPKTNLTEIVGDTPIDKTTLERYFYPKATKTKRDEVQVMQPKDQNTPIKLPARLVEAEQTPARKVGRPNKVAGNKNSEARSPIAPRTPAPGKENETPSTTGGRGAKDKAAAKLHGMAADITAFQKEMKRAGGVTHGGRQKSEDLVAEPSRKRSASASDQQASDAEDEPRKKAKKAKGAATMKILVTGVEPAKVSEMRAPLRNLGIMLTEDWSFCTHVAAAKILRTKKFVCAISKGPVVISIKFLEDCREQKELLDPDDYLLKDGEREKQFSLDLVESLERAKINNGKLLEGQSVYVTENVQGGYDTYDAIVRSNGGTPYLFKGRPGAMGGKKRSDDEENVTEDIVYLVSSSTPADVRLGVKFRQMAQTAGKVPRVVKPDWCLDACISQQIKWKDDYLQQE